MKLFDGHKHSPTSRRSHECFCKPPVRGIGQSRGAAHLKLVFMLMTGTRQNARELYADMIKAVSRLLVNHPDLVRRPSLVDDFNAIDLGRLRRQVRSMKCGVPTNDALLVLLSVEFKPTEGHIEAQVLNFFWCMINVRSVISREHLHLPCKDP